MYSETLRTVLRIGNRTHKTLGKPVGMNNGLWELIHTILAQDNPPSRRPSLEDIIVELEATTP
jgi:hypothetical protein